MDGLSIFTEDDHNLLYNGNGSLVYATGSGCNGAFTLSAYQLTFKKGTGSYQVDPLFINPDSYNFNLQTGSPAIDHGIDIGMTTDIKGVIRPQGADYDIGAYEFQSSLQPTFTPTLITTFTPTAPLQPTITPMATPTPTATLLLGAASVIINARPTLSLKLKKIVYIRPRSEGYDFGTRMSNYQRHNIFTLQSQYFSHREALY